MEMDEMGKDTSVHSKSPLGEEKNPLKAPKISFEKKKTPLHGILHCRSCAGKPGIIKY